MDLPKHVSLAKAEATIERLHFLLEEARQLAAEKPFPGKLECIAICLEEAALLLRWTWPGYDHRPTEDLGISQEAIVRQLQETCSEITKGRKREDLEGVYYALVAAKVAVTNLLRTSTFAELQRRRDEGVSKPGAEISPDAKGLFVLLNETQRVFLGTEVISAEFARNRRIYCTIIHVLERFYRLNPVDIAFIVASMREGKEFLRRPYYE